MSICVGKTEHAFVLFPRDWTFATSITGRVSLSMLTKHRIWVQKSQNGYIPIVGLPGNLKTSLIS